MCVLLMAVVLLPHPHHRAQEMDHSVWCLRFYCISKERCKDFFFSRAELQLRKGGGAGCKGPDPRCGMQIEC